MATKSKRWTKKSRKAEASSAEVRAEHTVSTLGLSDVWNTPEIAKIRNQYLTPKSGLNDVCATRHTMFKDVARDTEETLKF